MYMREPRETAAMPGGVMQYAPETEQSVYPAGAACPTNRMNSGFAPSSGVLAAASMAGLSAGFAAFRRGRGLTTLSFVRVATLTPGPS